MGNQKNTISREEEKRRLYCLFKMDRGKKERKGTYHAGNIATEKRGKSALNRAFAGGTSLGKDKNKERVNRVT